MREYYIVKHPHHKKEVLSYKTPPPQKEKAYIVESPIEIGSFIK